MAWKLAYGDTDHTWHIRLNKSRINHNGVFKVLCFKKKSVKICVICGGIVYCLQFTVYCLRVKEFLDVKIKIKTKKTLVALLHCCFVAFRKNRRNAFLQTSDLNINGFLA